MQILSFVKTRFLKSPPRRRSRHSRCCLRLMTFTLMFAWLFVGRAAEGTSRVKVVRAAGITKVVKAQRSPDGAIHLLFDTEDGPRYVKSQDSGLTFSSPVAVVNASDQPRGLQYSGWDLAVETNGRVHVAMGNNAWKLKLPREEWGYYYAALAAGAKSFSPLRNLNRKPSEGFSLAVDDRGTVTASFLSDKLFLMVSHDHGETFSPSAECNPAWDPCNCCTTSTAYGSDGKLALLYREETNNERDIYLIQWDQHRATQPIRRRISETPWKVAACPMTYFTITATDTGYVAVWPTKGQVYFARLGMDGALLPPGEIRTPGTAGMRTGLLALRASDGATLIAWKHKELLGWQLYNAKGETVGQPGSVASPGSGAAGVALPQGKFALFP